MNLLIILLQFVGLLLPTILVSYILNSNIKGEVTTDKIKILRGILLVTLVLGFVFITGYVAFRVATVRYYNGSSSPIALTLSESLYQVYQGDGVIVRCLISLIELVFSIVLIRKKSVLELFNSKNVVLFYSAFGIIGIILFPFWGSELDMIINGLFLVTSGILIVLNFISIYQLATIRKRIVKLKQQRANKEE